jgi:hypothetical protein
MARLDLALALGSNGLLKPGAHRADAHDLHAFTADPFGSGPLRSAVCSGIVTWLTHVGHRLGPGVGLVGGGFTSSGEPDDLALVGYVPDDRVAAAAASEGLADLDVQTIEGVVFSHPGQGGVAKTRWPVSGLVDALVLDPSMAVAFRKRISMVIGPDGWAVPGLAKGYVEIGVGRDG